MLRAMAVVLVLFLVSCSAKPAACAVENCTGCCDDKGACQPGTGLESCGASGAACTSCYTRHSVCTNQVCVVAPDGGGAGGGAGGGTGGGGGTVDAGPTTYPDGGSRFAYWDGGTCAVKTDCPCFSSDDCGPGFTCHSEDSTGVNVFCIPGARGAGLVGAGCIGEADCASAPCTDSTSSGMKCSALCGGAVDCVPSLPRCIDIGFGVNRSICSP